MSQAILIKPQQQIGLFDDEYLVEAVDPASLIVDFNEKEEYVISTISSLLKRNRKLIIGFSAGKDSSCVLSLTLIAAARLTAEGHFFPSIVISNSRTMMDNPEVENGAMDDMLKAVDFGDRHGFKVEINIAQPGVSSEFWVRVISGQMLPRFPGSTKDCTINLKKIPLNRARKKLLGGRHLNPPIVIVGTRLDESNLRSASMLKRKERADRPWIDPDGVTMLSPVMYWDEGDIWTHVQKVRSGKVNSYTDFNTVWDIYSAAGAGNGCPANGSLNTDEIKAARPCGARTGCHTCTIIGEKDKSLTNMIAEDEKRYGYMKPLNDIREFIFNTRWDLSRRMWLGRSINDHGLAQVLPDTYSSSMQRELLRYNLTAQVDEVLNAYKENRAPKFTILSMKAILTIDIYWSLYGQQERPFEAIHILHEIMQGKRFYPPKLDSSSFPRVSLPKAKYIRVGDNWDADIGGESMLTGLRDPMRELANEMVDDIQEFRANELPSKIKALQLKELETKGSISKRTLSDGRVVTNIPVSEIFEVDTDAANEFLDMALDMALEIHGNDFYKASYAYKWYAQMGIFSMSAGAAGVQDITMRRTSWRDRKNLIGDIDHDYLLSLCIDDALVPKGINIELSEESDWTND